MKIAVLIPGNKPNRNWKLAKQIGVDNVIVKLAPELTGSLPPWDYDSLVRSNEIFNRHGFNIAGFEGDQFDMSRIKEGRDGREEDLDKYCKMIENMGRVGIPILCYNFMAGYGWYRNKFDVKERGGAIVSAFNGFEVPNEIIPEVGVIEHETMWQNYKKFITTVMPVAESAKVKLCLHPDDPPVPQFRGISRIFSSVAGFRKAFDSYPSNYNRITFCQANFSLMPDSGGIIKAFDEFSERIEFIHFRDVLGTIDQFRETFHDNGPHDMAALLKHYHSKKFNGIIRPDHVPSMGERRRVKKDVDLVKTPTSVGYEMLGRLFAIGYMKGIMDASGIEYE